MHFISAALKLNDNNQRTVNSNRTNLIGSDIDPYLAMGNGTPVARHPKIALKKGVKHPTILQQKTHDGQEMLRTTVNRASPAEK